MEPTSDNRFDPNYAVQLLLEIAHEQSLEKILTKLVSRAIEHAHVACAQIWLINRGDVCSVCPHKNICPDQSRCLHLVEGKGISLFTSPEKATCFHPRNARIPLGIGVIGKAMISGQQIAIHDLQQRYTEMVGFEWLERENICACTISPITYKNELLGVIIVFIRNDVLREETLPWGKVFADHIGASIANARAFEEIQRLNTQLEKQNSYLKEEVIEAKAFGDLVGESNALQQIISQIELVAPTEALVLILGETGTGKELVAREVHRRSPRKDSSLVRINCASVPKDLFESEFFGHVKGAFTGAIKERAGRFETAEGGTLFLDEIGEVPLEMQSKLLRVLQEKRYERVGDDQTRHANVRIVAATNRDLKKAVTEGRFREDLYHRLHVFPIHVPPLRERLNDIPLLAKHFVDLSVKQLRCSKPRLTRAAITSLQNYDWPGNIRELHNVIERAVILARGGPLFFNLPVTHASSAASSSKLPNENKSVPEFFTEAEMVRRERDNLLVILEKSNWKIKGADGAAEILGVKPTTLLSRMKKMGISRPK